METMVLSKSFLEALARSAEEISTEGGRAREITDAGYDLETVSLSQTDLESTDAL